MGGYEMEGGEVVVGRESRDRIECVCASGLARPWMGIRELIVSWES